MLSYHIVCKVATDILLFLGENTVPASAVFYAEQLAERVFMKHHLRFYQQNRRLVLCLCGAVIGICAFLCIHTGASLDVTNDAWIHGGYVEMDVMQHYAGWLFYRNAPLEFPLGFASTMLTPNGTTLTNTDSIPLVAILCGLVRDWLPTVFQYFGWYTMLCYALQGVAAALLLDLFLDSFLNILLGCGFFVISPILMERVFRHTALGSQYLILFALYLYFLNKKQGHQYRVGFVVLCALAMAIHPYFVPMLLAILFADLLEHVFTARQWKRDVLFLCGCIAAVMATGWVIGAFSQISSTDMAAGYGFFGMNINALFNPRSINFGRWSAIIPPLAQNFGNYDSFQYMGVGVLALGVAGAIWRVSTFSKKRAVAFLKRYCGLLFCCFCLTVFAVSNQVSFFDHTLLDISLPAWLQSLCDTFRASGRMFWPVNYLLLLSIFVFWARRKRLGTLALCGALALQCFDLSPAIQQKRAYFAPTTTHESYLSGELWDTLAGRYEHVFSMDTQLLYPYAVALWCAENNTTSNDLFTSRYEIAPHHAAIADTLSDMQQGVYDQDTLYVTCNYTRFQEAAEALLDSGAQVHCAVTGVDASIAENTTKWYFIIPAQEDLILPAESSTLRYYENMPLMLPDYNDALWTSGVLNSDKRVMLLYDSVIAKRELHNAEQLVCDGIAYDILEVDDSDAGWLMVTLDIDDASRLAGHALTGSAGT